MCLHKTTHKHATTREVFAINPIVASFFFALVFIVISHALCIRTSHLISLFYHLRAGGKYNKNEQEKFPSCQKGSQHNSCIISASEIFPLLSFLFTFPPPPLHILSGGKSQRSCECSRMTFVWLKELYITWRKLSVNIILQLWDDRK